MQTSSYKCFKITYISYAKHFPALHNSVLQATPEELLFLLHLCLTFTFQHTPFKKLLDQFLALVNPSASGRI